MGQPGIHCAHLVARCGVEEDVCGPFEGREVQRALLHLANAVPLDTCENGPTPMSHARNGHAQLVRGFPIQMLLFERLCVTECAP
jgi:hypothetical protein